MWLAEMRATDKARLSFSRQAQVTSTHRSRQSRCVLASRCPLFTPCRPSAYPLSASDGLFYNDLSPSFRGKVGEPSSAPVGDPKAGAEQPTCRRLDRPTAGARGARGVSDLRRARTSAKTPAILIPQIFFRQNNRLTEKSAPNHPPVPAGLYSRLPVSKGRPVHCTIVHAARFRGRSATSPGPDFRQFILFRRCFFAAPSEILRRLRDNRRRGMESGLAPERPVAPAPSRSASRPPICIP